MFPLHWGADPNPQPRKQRRRPPRPEFAPERRRNNWMVFRTFTCKARPTCGLDCLICAIFSRDVVLVRVGRHVHVRPLNQETPCVWRLAASGMHPEGGPAGMLRLTGAQAPLQSENGTTKRFYLLRPFDCTTRPKSSVDCLTCAIFSRNGVLVRVWHHVHVRPLNQETPCGVWVLGVSGWGLQ